MASAARDRLHLRRARAEVRRRRLRRDRLRPRDVRRPPGALVTDPGVAATGHPERIADADARPRGIEAMVFDGAHVEPTDAVAGARRSRSPATPGPWDAFVAVGGGSAIDTAKAVNLLMHQPRRADGLRQRPGRQGPRARARRCAPLVAVPTTTGTGSESTTICVLDVLGAAGEDRHQPPAAAADAGRRRPAAHADPAGRW